MATQYPQDIQNYYGWMTGMLGPGVAPLSRALMNPSGLNTNEILRELWASWEGDNFTMGEFFLRALTMRGEYIRRLLPVEEYDVAIRNYGLRAKGDQVTFDVWNFESAVLPDQSRRHPGRRAEDDREQHSRAFRGGGVGFEVPMDWLENDTTVRHFSVKIEQMNRTIYLTWTFRVLQTLMYEGLDIYARRLQKILPMTHEEFSVQVDQMVARTFAMNKNGTNFSGIEARIVNQGQTRDVRYDTVITPPNSTAAMKLERARLDLYYMRGPEVLNSNKQAKDLAPEGNRTVHHGLNVYESREFPMGNGAPHQDPLANQCMVSQRFVMLPHRIRNGFRNYQSCFRDIEIPDGENRVWTRLDLRSALDACGMFAARGSSGERYLTPVGAEIIAELCQSHSSSAGGSNRDRSKQDSIARQHGESGTGSLHFPTATLSEAPVRRGEDMPKCARAWNLFRNAGLGRDIVDYFATMSPKTFKEFHDVVNTTAKNLRDTARDADFNPRGDTFESRYHRDDGRYSRYGVDDELMAYVPATATTRSSAVPVVAGYPSVGNPGVAFRPSFVLGGGGGLAHFDGRSDSAQPRGGVEDSKYDLDSCTFDDNTRIIAEFLFFQFATDAKNVNFVKRSVDKCFPGKIENNLSNVILPVLKINPGDDGRAIVIPYSSNQEPRSIDDLLHDAYWHTFTSLGKTSRLNQSPIKAWVKHAVAYIQQSQSVAAGGAAPAADKELHIGGAAGDNLEQVARTSWKLSQDTYNAGVQTYWAAMSLVGRAVTPATFNTQTPMLGPDGASLMSAVNSLSVIGVNRGGCSSVDKAYLAAFVGHLMDFVNPTSHSDPFIQTLTVASSSSDPETKVRIVVEFMKAQGGSLLHPSESDAFRASLNGPDDEGAKRAHKLDQSPAAIEAMLRELPTNYNFFDALIRCDIPFPISFILFRMHIRVQVSSVIFMVSGPATGVVVIKDGFLNFTRRQADFALDVGTRFRTATFITNRDNLELVPHAMAKRYLGGAGTTLYDPNTDVETFRNGAFTKDIFVMAVPYDWRPDSVWTDITGTMNSGVYNGASRGMSLNYTQFKTNYIYVAIWGFVHSQAHLFSAQAMGGLLHNPTLAIQATQRVHDGQATTSALTKTLEGHDPMGRMCEPIDYQILNGSTAIAGTGLEDIIPRKQLIAGY